MKGAPAYDCEHCVYRVYDSVDRLLYIGCTYDVHGRIAVHVAWGNPSEASFAIKLYGSRVEVQEFPDFPAARAAESEAIKTEVPLFNKEHNPKRWRRPRGKGWTLVDGQEPYAPVYAPESYTALMNSLRQVPVRHQPPSSTAKAGPEPTRTGLHPLTRSMT